ncbi:hypothetical protein LSH36_380g06018 [Paralvinella palmiformis]|uniref:Uncharacterized protein n=1 Tax=Paralvinella palmiformis TaxID=53620 RepID=A0AAD9JDR5_9ANNE|nr:hypothetical protein LSH36_380g06018 [Paralvinella palmiformis]
MARLLLLFAKTGLRFNSRWNTKSEHSEGGVFVWDLSKSDMKPKRVEINNYPTDMSQVDFHGLSCWTDNKTDEIYIFIVNQNETSSSVDVFIFDEEDLSLYYMITYQDPLFNVLKDIVAVNKQSFFITNYLYCRGTVVSKIEMLLMLRWGSVLFYDGETTSVVHDGLLMPNGIHKSPDNRYLYLAHTGLREVLIYRLSQNGTLSLRQRFPTYSLLGYITVDENGNIWAGSQPKGVNFIMHLGDPTVDSPSQVLRLKIEEGHILDITEPFVDDGRLISGSSVALYAKNKLLIGSAATKTIVLSSEIIAVRGKVKSEEFRRHLMYRSNR